LGKAAVVGLKPAPPCDKVDAAYEPQGMPLTRSFGKRRDSIITCSFSCSALPRLFRPFS
jgi:hypothetical protein